MKLRVKICKDYMSYFTNILQKIKNVSSDDYIKITFTDNCKMTIDIIGNSLNEEPIKVMFDSMFTCFEINKKKIIIELDVRKLSHYVKCLCDDDIIEMVIDDHNTNDDDKNENKDVNTNTDTDTDTDTDDIEEYITFNIYK
jgi:hypothetical protein